MHEKRDRLISLCIRCLHCTGCPDCPFTEYGRLKAELKESERRLLASLEKSRRFFSDTPQTSTLKRFDLKILKIIQQLETALRKASTK